MRCRVPLAGCLAAAVATCPAPAWADRENTRYTQELDCAEWNVGYPYEFRLATRLDVFMASISDATGDEYDVKARRRVMHYDFEPVSMAGVFGAWNVPGTSRKSPFRLEAGYSTSRPFGGAAAGDAGDRKTGALASLGLDSGASELLDLGLAWLGITGRAHWEHFAAGHVRVEDKQTGGETSAPLSLDRFSGRLGWNIPPIELFEEVDGEIRPWRPFGFTIYAEANDYVVPRILYRYKENGDPGPGEYRYTYLGETDPQPLRTRTYAVGGTAILQMIKSAHLGFTSHLELGGAFGGGSASFKDGTVRRHETLYVGKGDFAWLSSIRFGGPAKSLFEIGLQYNVEILSYFTGTSHGTFFEPSATDAFHGPRVEFIARF